MSSITASARGQQCQLRLPGVCRPDPATTVWAHSNRYADGKSAGKKAPDHCGAYACYWCHMVYDRQFARPAGLTLAMVEAAFTRAMAASQALLLAAGLWDGAPARQAPRTRPAKRRKQPVQQLSSLQRLCARGRNV